MPLADFGASTLVLRSGETGYIGQFRFRGDRTLAQFTFLAPDPRQGNIYEWAHLIEAAAFEAGRRGVHVITAEVAADHPVFEAFRVAGFAVYARQAILRREPDRPVEGPSVLLRPALDLDAVAINLLYTNTTPRLVQQVDPLRVHEAGGLLYERGGQMAAYLAITEGKSGIVIKPFFHPEVHDRVADIVLSALAHLPRARQVPVYLYARSYQDWLRGVLDQVGFETWTDQVLMAKFTVVRVERMEPVSVSGLEASRLRPPVVDGPLTLRKLALLPRFKAGRGRPLSHKRNGHQR